MIEIQNIVKHYGNKTALNNVSMTIPDDCIVGLVGQNGAGKSTLLKILTGILDADSGCCIYDGKPFSTCIMEDVGYLPEQRGLYNKINVQEQLEYFASLRGLSIKQSRSAIDFWLSKFDIDDWRKRKISELSKGMQQKVQLITCLMHSPKYVFMDEPLSGIDPLNFEVFTDVIKEYQQENNAIVILSTHNMKSIEKMCNRVAFIDKSELKVYDDIANIKKQYIKKNSYVITISSEKELDICSISDKLLNKAVLRSYRRLSQSVLEVHIEHTIANTSCNEICDMVKAFEGYNILSCNIEIPTMDEIFIKLTK